MLENVFFVVLLFGFLTFLFQKLRGAPASRERTGGMPPFGQGPKWDDLPKMSLPRRKIEEEQRPAVYESRQAVPQKSDGRSLIDKETDVFSTSVFNEEKPQVKPAVKAHQPKPAAGQTVKASPFAEAGPQSAVQGMMWAEVFGAPRSKQPYGKEDKQKYHL